MTAKPSPPLRAAIADGTGGGGDLWTRRYRVFLSYSHADTKWATWLMRKLEGFRVPGRFHGRAAPIGEIDGRIAPVFRDRDELPTADDLGDAVRDALERSATLVVICSPAAARSRWVNEEVVAFKRLGRSDRVFALIVAGEPNAKNESEECFPPALRFAVGSVGTMLDKPIELIAADARPHADGKDDAFLRLVAGLLGVGFDDLRQRELQRRHRRMTLIAVSAAVGMALTAGLALYAMRARDAAQRRQEQTERLLAPMLEDLRVELVKESKLDALEKTSNQIMAFFQTLDPRDLTDTTLMQQAKALTQIGLIRQRQLHYPEASAAFTEAFSRSVALTRRHPENADMLFERAQAEFYVGNVHYKLGELAAADEWLTRYRDSALALARIEPGARSQQEEISGYHNLAVLELERSELAKARSAFAGELTVREDLAAASPHDAQLQFSVANVISFLGTVAERSGDFLEAAKRYGEQCQRLEALIALEPDTAHWRRRLADALGFQSFALALSGQREEALARRPRIRELLNALVAQDPMNREWQFALASAQAKEAWFFAAAGDTAAAEQLVRECRPILEKLAAEKNADRVTKQMLALSWRIEAQVLATANPRAAAAAAAQASTLGKTLLDSKQAGEPELGEYATACVLAGVLARQRDDVETARRCWQSAADATRPLAAVSSHWRVLDPAARALIFLGRVDEGLGLVQRLQRLGYAPLEPWPEAVRVALSASNHK